MTLTNAKPIFVIGCPRSGTTLVQKIICTDRQVLDVGEFGGFYYANLLKEQNFFGHSSSEAKELFLSRLSSMALDVFFELSENYDNKYVCDSTPGNTLYIEELERIIDEAIYVCVYRNPQDTINSLRHSYNNGFEWAGACESERVELWCRYNIASCHAPLDRTYFINYDDLINEPKKSIEGIFNFLNVYGISADWPRIMKACSISYSTKGEPSTPPLSVKDESGTINFSNKSSLESATERMSEDLMENCGRVELLVKRIFKQYFNQT
ncbi:sulfotransferase family protein [Vibrio parahaemolyticus]